MHILYRIRWWKLCREIMRMRLTWKRWCFTTGWESRALGGGDPDMRQAFTLSEGSHIMASTSDCWLSFWSTSEQRSFGPLSTSSAVEGNKDSMPPSFSFLLPLSVAVFDSSNQPNSGFTTPGFSRTQYSNSYTRMRRACSHKEAFLDREAHLGLSWWLHNLNIEGLGSCAITSIRGLSGCATLV